jgi:hypothetical protein
VEGGLAVKDATKSLDAFMGSVKLMGCMEARLVPNTSAEFICPLSGTFP